MKKKNVKIPIIVISLCLLFIANFLIYKDFQAIKKFNLCPSSLEVRNNPYDLPSCKKKDGLNANFFPWERLYVGYRWYTKNDYDAISLGNFIDVSIDEQKVDHINGFTGVGTYYYGNKQNAYAWNAGTDFGCLVPGEHEIKLKIEFPEVVQEERLNEKPVNDLKWFGPNTENPSIVYTCKITVEPWPAAGQNEEYDEIVKEISNRRNSYLIIAGISSLFILYQAVRSLSFFPEREVKKPVKVRPMGPLGEIFLISTLFPIATISGQSLVIFVLMIGLLSGGLFLNRYKKFAVGETSSGAKFVGITVIVISVISTLFWFYLLILWGGFGSPTLFVFIQAAGIIGLLDGVILLVFGKKEPVFHLTLFYIVAVIYSLILVLMILVLPTIH